MEEWQKILVTACASFAVGVSSETLKGIFRRRSLRNHLYSRLVYARCILEEAKDIAAKKDEGWEEQLIHTLGQLSTSLYDWCTKSDAVTFYGSSDADAFDVIYDNVKQLKSECVHTADQAARGVTFTLEKIIWNLQAGRFSCWLYLKHYRLFQMKTSLWSRRLRPKKVRPPVAP
jgi:hypothetical protein